MEKPRHIVTTTIDWQGIALSVSYEDRWLGGSLPAHIQVQAEHDQPLPITGTGYRSHFLPREEVEQAGGPVPYVLTWLAEEATSDEWRDRMERSRQSSLF